ncbi:hypothetical protein [Nonomuraea sp. SYSU D8015]|uniref:hypothetical protein n=1 Tax=Nonomuraea sp. SYSU D8015 TaxID=2593644 RepID=UPI001660875D|nr:hypothetical protein [Nonomuraea sp. SYSU D8015]
MAPRYEMDGADTALEIVTPDTDPDDHCIDMMAGSHALVIGNPDATAFAVVGSPEDLRVFAARVCDLVARALPVDATVEPATPRSHSQGMGPS